MRHNHLDLEVRYGRGRMCFAKITSTTMRGGRMPASILLTNLVRELAGLWFVFSEI